MEEGGRGGGGGDGLTDKCYKRALIKPLRMVECNGVNLTSMRKKTVCHRVLSRAHDGKDCFKIYNPLAFPWKTASISTSVKLFACFRFIILLIQACNFHGSSISILLILYC